MDGRLLPKPDKVLAVFLISGWDWERSKELVWPRKKVATRWGMAENLYGTVAMHAYVVIVLCGKLWMVGDGMEGLRNAERPWLFLLHWLDQRHWSGVVWLAVVWFGC